MIELELVSKLDSADFEFFSRTHSSKNLYCCCRERMLYHYRFQNRTVVICLRLSRNNRTTIANTDMKRLNRRYASVKKKLNLKKNDRTLTTPDDSIEQMNLYHKAVLMKITHKDFYKKLDQNAMARDFFLENHAVKHTVKRYVIHETKANCKP